ncbi:4Fe-4S ferredoxin [Sporanaerobium hydrogeniformans]|uniref:4Fe-4S ferredoxin n=1 Tax=Sporanaerobium hydrogeniformans TaxID=3072179 RepID=A0AC61DBU2_9FIRM|nr:4Fe-4S binding protein [Sporanaerobium hydrogeniformans]PHV70714.1 4Fe-4S ferredoxin [Sporanaerobium hydrogeniformans]
MVRQIVKIDEDKCNGCGLCVTACHEGAIGMVNGKAKLLRDDYCDGLGNCLPVCPTNAISFEEREAAAFDEEAVKINMENKHPKNLACGCPGTQSKTLKRNSSVAEKPLTVQTHLNQWPVQIKLVPSNASYLNDAHLVIAADCTAYAYGDFHSQFMKNKITLIGCPKLDEGDYSEKLTAILKMNTIKSVTVVRMEVPCCGGIEKAFKTALKECDKLIPWQVVTLSTDGRILEL